jgi:hypothetical protein
MPRDNNSPLVPASRRIALALCVVAVVSIGFWLFGPKRVTSNPVMIYLTPSMP